MSAPLLASRNPGLPLACYAAVLRTPFAHVGIRTGSDHIVGIDYLDFDAPLVAPANDLARAAAAQIEAYLRDPSRPFDLPWMAAGTAFQQRVWGEIARIASGSTRTYGELAAVLGSAPRAVGGACGSNPVPLLVPCHRVTAAGGRLGGFMHSRSRLPLSIKQWLLDHEAKHSGLNKQAQLFVD